MKLILSLLSVSLVFHSLAQNTATEMGLKGKVKSLQSQETYRYQKNGAFTPWEKTYKRNYQFDKTGRYTEYEEKSANGNSGYTVKYTHKPAEKKIGQAFFDKDNNPTITKTVSLDDKGRMTEITEYSKDGKPDRSYVYTYDEKGNNTVMTVKRADGTITTKYTRTYNEKNQRTAQTLETPGYASSYISWTYDAKGNQNGETWYDGNRNITFRFERVFDEKGNKTEESKYKNGTELRDRVTWKYEYDQQGNWTKRTQYTNSGEDFHIEERTIVYY